MGQHTTENKDKLPAGTHVRRASDLVASKVRQPGDSHSTLRIASQHLNVSYQTLVAYANGHNPVPVELAKEFHAFGYPRHLLRPDVWEE